MITVSADVTSKTCSFLALSYWVLIVYYTFQSVQKLERVEQRLFEVVEDLPVTYLSSVQIDDEIVVVAKQRISAVVLNNSHGPER